MFMWIDLVSNFWLLVYLLFKITPQFHITRQ